MRVVKSFVREDYETKEVRRRGVGRCANDFTTGRADPAPTNAPLMQFCVYMSCMLFVLYFAAELIMQSRRAPMRDVGQLCLSMMTYSFQILTEPHDALDDASSWSSWPEESAERIAEVLDASRAASREPEHPVREVRRRLRRLFARRELQILRQEREAQCPGGHRPAHRLGRDDRHHRRRRARPSPRSSSSSHGSTT